MLTTHKLNEKAIAVTGLPDEACNFDVKTLSAMFDSHFIMTYKTPHRWETFGKRNYHWDTRSEKPMTVLGRAADLSEDDWKRVVPVSYVVSNMIVFPDYVNGGNQSSKNGIKSEVIGFDNASQSANSLLKSKGIELLNTLILIIE